MKTVRYILPISLSLLSLSLHAQNIEHRKELNNARNNEQRAVLLYKAGLAWHNKKNEDSAKNYAARAYALAKKTGNDSLAMQSAALVGDALKRTGATEQAATYYDTALQYARKLQRPADEMRYLERTAFAYKSIGRHYLSLDKFSNALQLAVSLNDKAQEAYYYKIMASEYASSDDYGPVLDLIRRSIHIYDSLREPVKSADNYMELEIMYSKQKKYKQALKYGFLVDSIYASQKDTVRANDNRINIAVIYKNMGEYDNATHIYRSFLTKSNIDDFEKMVVYHNLAVALSGKGDYEEAQRKFLAAAEINRSVVRETFFDIANCKEMATAAFRAHRLDTALYYALLGERYGKSSDLESDDYKDIVWLLSDIHAARGDWGKAHLYDRQYIALQDTINHRRHMRAMAEAETRFDLVEKNKQLAILSKENELQKVRSQKQRTVNALLFVGLLLGSLAGLVVVRVYRRTMKQNTLLYEQKKIIDDQVAQLAVAAGMKSRFFANISHELRTPVTLLTGMLELLKEKPADTNKEKQTLEIAHANSVRLQHMIEEILDLARQESQPDVQTRIHIKELSPLLVRIVAAFETHIHNKDLHLQYDDKAITGTYMAVDEDKFEKIINNLVYNAVKFNEPGGRVGIAATLSNDKQHITIAVSNTGKGIPPADLPHIFDRYYQSEGSGARAQGLGIGLSLVQEFTTLLGGTIAVTSVPGQLTTFSLQFPVVGKDMEEVLLPETTLPDTEWKSSAMLQTVLIVEDNTEMRYYIREILGGNINILEAENGSAALTLLQRHTPDLIISDMMMPEMNGQVFVAKLKETITLKNIPVIMLTALADKENQLGMLRMGVDDYIVKPFNAEELRIRVRNLLLNYAARRVFSEQPAEEGDIVLDNKEAEEFRVKLTESVIARLKYTNVSVADIAYDLTVSERQLFRLAKSLTGCSPAQLIKEVRLQKAYELLINGEVYKIEDVSKRVGFDNAGYFSRQFFERFGKRPTELL